MEASFYRIVTQFIYYSAKCLGLTMVNLKANVDKCGNLDFKSEAVVKRRKVFWSFAFGLWIVFLIAFYPYSILALKFATQNQSSFFSISIIITLYFHYVMLLVVVLFVVLKCRRDFSQFLVDFAGFGKKLSAWLNAESAICRFPEPYPATASSRRTTRGRLVLLAWKCLVFEVAFLLFCWLNLNWSIMTSFNSIIMLFHSIVLISPTILLAILSNLFYATSSIMDHFMDLFNGRVARCMTAINYAPADRSKGQHQWSSASAVSIKLWQLSISDDIDGIIQYYGRTLKFLQQSNKFHSLPILVVLLNCFFNIVVQLFSIYMTLSKPTTLAQPNDVEESIEIVLINCVYVIINYIKVIIIIRTTNVFTSQIEATLDMLNEFTPTGIVLDSRLVQSIEFLYLELFQYLNDGAEVSPGGFFALDYSLITMITGAAIGYLIILVQYEME